MHAESRVAYDPRMLTPVLRRLRWSPPVLVLIVLGAAGCGSGDTKPTSGQKKALTFAQRYVDTVGVSKDGLIFHMSSPIRDGSYSKADATYAADHVEADWNAEAVESAASILSSGTTSSEAELLEGLTKGELFTDAQAHYALTKSQGWQQP